MRHNAHEVEPSTGFDPIPNGTYRVRIDSAIELDNKNRNGKYLELVLQVVGPTHVGRKLWARYTTEHETSEQAVTIGLGHISALSRAVGHPVWNHESELVGLVGECKVGRERNDPERNEVKSWVIDEANKGVPTYNRARQAQGAAEHDVNRRGGQLANTVARMPDGRPTPPPFTDDGVPF